MTHPAIKNIAANLVNLNRTLDCGQLLPIFEQIEIELLFVPHCKILCCLFSYSLNYVIDHLHLYYDL